MSNIKFLSTLVPLELEQEIDTKSNGIMTDAANALQWSIYNGLSENYGGEIDIINLLPVGSFPQYYADPFIKKSFFKTQHSDNNVNIPFCNVKLIRQSSQSRRVYKALLEAFRDDNDGVLFVYTISTPFVKAIDLLKKVKRNIKVCAIIADMPNMSDLAVDRSFVKKIYANHLANTAFHKLDCIDAYVLLTKHMAEYLNIKKPFCVVEGIATEAGKYACDGDIDGERKIIMYSGTLHQRFGILNLVEAFEKIRNPKYSLIICGTGDSEALIKKYAASDTRIKFLGKVPRKEVLGLQRNATVLVNPRQNNESFTKYSFPSKTMEYLSAGKPVIAYKLDGIPDEYDDYIFYVNDNSVESLAERIEEICEKTNDELEKYGTRGRTFVLDNKNYLIQTKKIMSMMSNL